MLHSICQQIWKTQQWPQDWKKSVSTPIPQKGNVKKCSNYHTVALISHAIKVILKILQTRLQKYVNWEVPDVQVRFRKSRETKDQIANIHWQGNSRKKGICFIDSSKAFDLVDHTKLWKIIKEMEISDHLTCLLRNLYVNQEAKVRTRHGKDFLNWKGLQGCILSTCLVNLYAEYIMWNAGPDES